MEGVEFLCKLMPTRHCPKIYQSICGERPCARFESDDESPWIPEVEKIYGVDSR